MAREHWLKAAALAVVLLDGMALYQFCKVGPGVNRANFDRLHSGMTIQEVSEIMGRPADIRYYTTLCMTYIWTSDEGRVVIRQQGELEGVFQIDDKDIAVLPTTAQPYFKRLLHRIGIKL